MSYQSRFTFSRATAEDAEAIRDIFNELAFEGNIAVQYLRGENPVESFENECDELVALLLRDVENDNRAVGIGCCTIRKGYVSGKVCNIGYLTGLKLCSDYQRKFHGIMDAYRWIHENTIDKVDYYYTTILTDNVYVRKMLEKSRKNMPIYHYISDYNTLLFKTGGRMRGHDFLIVDACDSATACDFYSQKAVHLDFAVKSLDQNHLSSAKFYALYKNKEVIAVATVSDMRQFKQNIVRSYDGIYRLLRHLPTKLTGYPPFPKPNETVNLGSCAIYCGADAEVEELQCFFQQIQAYSTEFEILMIGVTAGSTPYQALIGLKNIGYKSRFYQVSYKKDDLLSCDTVSGVDVSFM